jgi:hypothetical protein
LASIIDYGIHYSRYPVVLEGNNDVNWISDMNELYAMSGYVFTLGSAAVSWRTCKQTVLTSSTTTLDTTIVEANWLRELLMDLPIVKKSLPTILMNGDNQMVVVKLYSSKDNMKSSRHIKRQLKSIRKMRNFGVITLDYIHIKKNMIDPFTKGLSCNVIDATSKEMGLRPT